MLQLATSQKEARILCVCASQCRDLDSRGGSTVADFQTNLARRNAKLAKSYPEQKYYNYRGVVHPLKDNHQKIACLLLGVPSIPRITKRSRILLAATQWCLDYCTVLTFVEESTSFWCEILIIQALSALYFLPIDAGFSG